MYAHIFDCDDCARSATAVHAADQEVGLLLAMLDLPVPVGQPRGVPFQSLGNTWRMRGILAAGVATLFVVGVAAVIQRSQIARWISQVAGPPATQATLIAEPPIAATPAPPMGVRVVPGSHTIIRLERPETAGFMRLQLVPGRLLTVRAQGGTVKFAVGPDEITINNQDPASSYEVSVPRNLIGLQVLVGGRLVFTKTGKAIRSSTKPDRSGAYIIPLAPHRLAP